MGFRVGVDIGGTFTDFAVLDETDGSIISLKVFSRPDQPGAEVIQGMQTIKSQHGIAADEVSYFTHGTTVGVNTVIQRKGLRLALFATRNFEDVLEIARLKIPDMYNLCSRRPIPLIPRKHVFSIDERIDADGSVFSPLQHESVTVALRTAQSAGCEGIVIALLHAYRNPIHELAVKAIVEANAPELPIFCSSQIWPIIREYERTITAVISGYVQPRVAHYLGSLQTALAGLGVKPELHIAKSNGGVMSAEQGKSNCVQMIMSGTASGVMGASYISRACGLSRVMSLDIGGTSADVAVINDSNPQYGVGERIGEFQIFIPSVAVSSIGQGGGSIAWVDDLGVLKVGPESAGASPGPACYGRGGLQPTITDAFAACGLVGHSELGYNAVKVDVNLASAAVASLATRLGRTIHETAEAIIRISVSGMYAEVNGLISRFGIDPREYSLLAFGGAGPMLACLLARELRMRQVVVPLTPGVLSALGGLIADLKNDYVTTVYCDLQAGAAPSLRDHYAALREKALYWLSNEQRFPAPGIITYSADMRYNGQSFEIETPLDIAWIEAGDIAAITEAFHTAHEALFEHCDRKAAIQIISLRLTISGATPKPALAKLPVAETIIPATTQRIRAYLDGEAREISLYRRQDLLAGHRFEGPAVIQQDDCTTLVPEGFTVRVDPYGNMLIVPVFSPAVLEENRNGN